MNIYDIYGHNEKVFLQDERKSDFHVSENGSDMDGNGSLAMPYATIQRAVDIAKELNLCCGGVNIIVEDGFYCENIEISGMTGINIIGNIERPHACIIKGFESISKDNFTIRMNNSSGSIRGFMILPPDEIKNTYILAYSYKSSGFVDIANCIFSSDSNKICAVKAMGANIHAYENKYAGKLYEYVLRSVKGSKIIGETSYLDTENEITVKEAFAEASECSDIIFSNWPDIGSDIYGKKYSTDSCSRISACYMESSNNIPEEEQELDNC